MKNIGSLKVHLLIYISRCLMGQYLSFLLMLYLFFLFVFVKVNVQKEINGTAAIQKCRAKKTKDTVKMTKNAKPVFIVKKKVVLSRLAISKLTVVKERKVAKMIFIHLR